MSHTISVQGLHAHWQRRAIIRGYDGQRSVSFQAEGGTWVAVVGDNGVGKSTLFHAIAGTAPYVTGDISVRGDRLTPRDVMARFEHGILHVPQEAHTTGVLHWVEDAVALGTMSRPALKNEPATSDLKARLAEMNLVSDGRCSADVFDLIACIVAVPQVIMLDELRARVASDAGSAFYANLRPLLGRAVVLFIEHDVELALSVADSVVWLRDDAAPLCADVPAVRAALAKRAPVDEGPKTRNASAVERALRIVRRDESTREQVELAVRSAQRRRAARKSLVDAVVDVWPFMAGRRPAETLSGGERITLAWLLLHASGHGQAFPLELAEHLDKQRRAEMEQVAQRLGGMTDARS
jgi:ABC-type branched-subunit amino acid transport system ATPase component